MLQSLKAQALFVLGLLGLFFVVLQGAHDGRKAHEVARLDGRRPPETLECLDEGVSVLEPAAAFAEGSAA